MFISFGSEFRDLTSRTEFGVGALGNYTLGSEFETLIVSWRLGGLSSEVQALAPVGNLSMRTIIWTFRFRG